MTDPPVSNLASFTQFNTGTKIFTANIKLITPSIANLDSYQYQGDYNIIILTSTTGVTAKAWSFILRVNNPCQYLSYTDSTTFTKNTLNVPAVTPSITTSVLVPASTTYNTITDAASLTYTTVNGYSLCGARTYTQLTAFTWFSQTTGPASNTVTASPLVPADIQYTPLYASCWNVQIKGQLALYPTIFTNQIYVTVCIEECKPTSFTPDTTVAD